MTKILFMDCFSGISGDMILGAFIDAGVPLSVLNYELRKLNLNNFKLTVKRVKKENISAVKLNVSVKKTHCHRSYTNIVKIINKSTLKEEIKQKAKDIFYNLAKVESRIHNERMSRIYFHELGGIDTIIDIVGALICLNELGINKVFSSSVNVGGCCEISTSHGILPNPAPATVELLKGLAVHFTDIPFELVTPTGAAILSYLVEKKEKITEHPEVKFIKAGYGAGDLNFDKQPNVLRVLIGDINSNNQKADEVMVIEANIDDLLPLIYDTLMEKLFKSGALDVFLTNIYMKKNRPAIKLTVLCEKKDFRKITEDIFKETTTFGLRYYVANRLKLQREFKIIRTKWGNARVKVGKLHGNVISVSPEFEDCKKIAIRKGIAVKLVYDEIKKYAKHVL